MNRKEYLLKKLWIQLSKIVQCDIVCDICNIETSFITWHNNLKLEEKQRIELIECWENFLTQKQEGLQSDDDDYEKRWKESILWQIFAKSNGSCPLSRNPFYQFIRGYSMPSMTYAHLYDTNERVVAKIETKGNRWSEAKRAIVDGDKLENFGQLVGLDLVVQNVKKIPEVSIVCQSEAESAYSETSAAMSFMMLKQETKDLRALARSLYPVLKRVLHRKIVIDRVIFFLMRDLHRCSGAAFIDCCPSSLKSEFSKNLFIPLYIPFHQQGYCFEPNIKVTSTQKVELIAWKNNTQMELKGDDNDTTYREWYYQFIKESMEHIETKIANDFIGCWNFPIWRLFRPCLLIQSDKELAKIIFESSNKKDDPCFICEDPKKILVAHDDYYWYSISLLMTHNHLEALFSTVLYHPKIMQLRFSCWNQYHRLTIHKTDPKTNIQLYSRTLNLLEARLDLKKSFPKFYDCI